MLDLPDKRRAPYSTGRTTRTTRGCLGSHLHQVLDGFEPQPPFYASVNRAFLYGHVECCDPFVRLFSAFQTVSPPTSLFRALTQQQAMICWSAPPNTWRGSYHSLLWRNVSVWWPLCASCGGLSPAVDLAVVRTGVDSSFL